MKKTIFILVLATHWLNLSMAQGNKAIDLTSKGLQVGQSVPDISISGISNYPEKSAKFSDFRGKMLILDFWATWCSPCVAMIPRMEALQEQFKDKIQILKVTYQTPQEVLPFLEKLQKGKPSNLPDVLNDRELHKLFPHAYLPHYVWIDGTGTVRAITSYEEVNAVNIEKLIQSSTAAQTFKQKQDFKRAYDPKKPFLLNQNGADLETLSYHSLFSTYSAGITGRNRLADIYLPDSSHRVVLTSINQCVKNLYKRAYGNGKNIPNSRVILEVKDTSAVNTSLTGNGYIDWMGRGNAFCYELMVEPRMEPLLFKIMQRDLNINLWQYKASITHKEKECLVLIRTSKQDKLKSKGEASRSAFSTFGCHLQNKPLNLLTERMGGYYMQNSDLPVIDGTGYTGPVDLHLEASLTNISDLNKQLEAYDLKFVRMKKNIEVLVISDRTKEEYLKTL